MSRIEQALRRAGVTHVWADSFAVKDDERQAEARVHEVLTQGPPPPMIPSPVTPSVVTAVVPPQGPVSLPAPVAPHSAAGFTMPRTVTGLSPDAAARMVTSPNASPQMVGQFRLLGAALHQQPRPSGVVLLTSAIASEGKTFTAMNLALTLSESFRRRVVLVDADLRRPSIHTLLGQPLENGLSDVLSTGEPRPLRGVTENLAALTAGAAMNDPIPLLTSERLPRVIGQLASVFDWVVIDTPPTGPLPDVGLLAAHADIVLFVIEAGRTPWPVAQRALESISKNRVTGVVLNRFVRRNTSDAYSSYTDDSYTA
jgi:protein-tyrosine kinase